MDRRAEILISSTENIFLIISTYTEYLIFNIYQPHIFKHKMLYVGKKSQTLYTVENYNTYSNFTN